MISGCIEIGTALLFLRLKKVETALQLNAILGLVGPIIFIMVNALGLIAISVKVSPAKVGLISLGVLLIVLGSKST
jgi:hypothetical protein